jgi:hypothetical protein
MNMKHSLKRIWEQRILKNQMTLILSEIPFLKKMRKNLKFLWMLLLKLKLWLKSQKQLRNLLKRLLNKRQRLNLRKRLRLPIGMNLQISFMVRTIMVL